MASDTTSTAAPAGPGAEPAAPSTARRRADASSRETPLLPKGSIAGRSLVVIIAIMTFLASLTAGTVELVATASSAWRGDVSREVTIQVRPRSGRDIEADVARAAALARAGGGFAEVRVYDRRESEQLLEPWLGSGLDLADMPVPRLILLKLGATVPDLAGLRAALAREVPSATLDDHRLWLARLSAMAATMVGVGLLILVLVLVAMGLAVAFATRGAMAGNKAIIEVLHMVGATDMFISGQFQKHFLLLGLKGGAIGGAAAMLCFAAGGLLSQGLASTPGGDQVEALFGTFSLGPRGYAAVVGIALLVAVVTAVVSRLTVYRNLRGLD
jgi:cell division transport system permease protein